MPGKNRLAQKRGAAVSVLLLLAAGFASAEDDASRLPRQADIAISGALLNHPPSAEKPWNITIQLDDPDSDHPKAYVCNQDKTERLALVFYEGDTANIISEFKVERVTTRYVDCVVPEQPFPGFVTAKGIRLGMQKRELVEILGQGYSEYQQPDETVISYRIDHKDSDFLLRQNAPAYYGQYHFQENRLVRFAFGFEFP